MSNEEQATSKIKIGGLWKKEGKDGTVFYSGNLSYSSNLLLFKNKFKRSERDPDLILYISEKKKKDKEGDEI